MLGIGRVDVDHVAAHAEAAARKVVVVAVVLDVDEAVDELVALERHLLVHVRRQARVVLRAADAVDAGHGRDHDDVAAGQQRGRGLVAQHLDLLVDGGVLLDIGIRLRNVGLGLVVIVVGDKIDHRVMREELLELACKLRGERLVGSHHQRGLAQRLDGLCHGECLTGAGDAQQHLIAVSAFYALNQGFDCLGLVAGRLEG